ncbi:hypothetical protein THOM_1674 [Trachipleistophora hominis]|uniref:Uncharacterized protein n=1 Tax=Trachipleistophora hominis TaxID=72359 RepID=L7JXA3_TRAHO|nr:hypothetical protein THOM_1674 [Trachipleistophora hominis]
MLILPGERDAEYVVNADTNEKMFFEPLLKIGSLVRCRIIRAWPVYLELEITHIDGHATNVQYKAVYRPNFIEQDVNAVFLDGSYKYGSDFEGKVVSYGDNMGVVIGLV